METFPVLADCNSTTIRRYSTPKALEDSGIGTDNRGIAIYSAHHVSVAMTQLMVEVQSRSFREMAQPLQLTSVLGCWGKTHLHHAVVCIRGHECKATVCCFVPVQGTDIDLPVTGEGGRSGVIKNAN